jgi:hypothetical protein
MIHMVLCPQCRTIQKAGTTCGICTCIIPERNASPLARSHTLTNSGGVKVEGMPLHKAKAIKRLADRDVFA